MKYFTALSAAQKLWFAAALTGFFLIIAMGLIRTSEADNHAGLSYSTDQSLGKIARSLGVTGKALAKDLNLPIDVTKKKPVRALGVSQEQLDAAVEHLASHEPSALKYFVFGAITFFGLIYMVRLGRPDRSKVNERNAWYNRTPYILMLVLAVSVAGFALGKSPNPMEGVVKVFKAMVGLYPSILDKFLALIFFLALAVVGNKLICGWACPFGALQELIYSLPILKKLKRRKIPFALSNTIRMGLFLTALLLLFGVVGGHKGYVVYHGLNPFNLFDLSADTFSIILTITISLIAAIGIYRPFCYSICPFGLISWVIERTSLAKVHIDPAKCTKCGACARACPSQAASDRIKSRAFPSDCFSCARCLNACPYDAIRYGFPSLSKEKGST